MPRQPNPTPPLRLHKGTQLYYIFLNNRRHYLGRHKPAAEEKRRRLIAESLTGRAESSKLEGARPLTCAEACEVYLRHVQPRVSACSYHRVYRAMEAVIELYGATPVIEFKALHLDAVRLHLMAQKQRRCNPNGIRSEGDPLSRRYLNHLTKTILQAWTWLESRGHAPEGRSAHLRTLRGLREGEGGREPPHVLAVDVADVEAVLPYCAPVVGDMVRVQLLTGMRPGEMVQMTPAAIARTPEQKVPVPGGKPVGGLVINGKPVWVYAPPKHKTRYRGKYRLVALGPQVQAILEPYLKNREPDQPLFSPRESARRALAIRRKRGGQGKPLRGKRMPKDRYTTLAFAQGVGRAVGRCNRDRAKQNLPPVEDWNPNQLRHAVATLAEATSGRDTAQAVLGHASPDVTAIYAEQALRRAALFVIENG